MPRMIGNHLMVSVVVHEIMHNASVFRLWTQAEVATRPAGNKSSGRYTELGLKDIRGYNSWSKSNGLTKRYLYTWSCKKQLWIWFYGKAFFRMPLYELL